MVRFETTHGSFTIELFPKEAPVTVENFLKYVDDGFFDGTIFHRIVPGFVIQGGGLTADFDNKETRDPIKNESTNGLQNRRGTLERGRPRRGAGGRERRRSVGCRQDVVLHDAPGRPGAGDRRKVHVMGTRDATRDR